ncbi:winged helix DNA-binding domain-containing protein [Montanilutibacter psychrotolerans]|uniref:Winged helix DNA-binding domain-containing protein n=1 Tax=Montanilutibacter psychrotolerans TaxID=1327343 RepID=A0A3M8SKZ4_9GAMM|nr:winged helix DNA-binding domain-containing protein [Lysobacter psychrotolerans]RNF82037.1 winged helix DNA-binding domain-containing protein [Lysobacter psychrotolerans]
MPDRPLTPLQLNRALLARQLLLKRQRLPVRDVVHAVAGLQSQEPKDPYVALWSRSSDFTGQQLVAAAQAREVVRGSFLRGTIHTVSVDDYVAFRQLLQPLLNREIVSNRHLAGGFDPAELEVAARALLAGGALTARQVGEALAERFPQAQTAGLASWVRSCIALATVPGDDRWGYPRPPRFVPAVQWLDRPLDEAGVGAAEALVMRALTAIGPVSIADLRSWSGLTGLSAVVQGMGARLRSFRDQAGRELFDLDDAPRPPATTPAPVRFLPEFDNALLAHADRSRIIPPELAGRFAMASNGRRERAVLVDGFVRATWSHACTRGAAGIEVKLLGPQPAPACSDIAEEAEALLRFLEPEATSIDVRLVAV